MMRRTGIVLAGAVLVLLPAGPGARRAAAQEAGGGVVARSVMAVADGGPEAGVAQAVAPMDHDRYRHGRYRDGRHRYRHDGRSYGGGHCYGCDGPGSYCDASGCYHRQPYYGGYYGDPYGPGGYRGGYGCGYDYPCGPPYGDDEASS